VKLALAAAATPLFTTLSLKEASPPPTTGLLFAAAVVPRSAEAAATTTVVALAVLLPVFGSDGHETVAVSVTAVPAAVPGLIFSVNGKFTDAPVASGVGVLQLIGPVPPIAGVMHVQPAGGVMPWKVVLGGVDSANVRLAAAAPPPLRTVCV
jgi:hypothetical protein